MTVESLTTKYIRSAEKVISELEQNPTPIKITKETIITVLDWATDYLNDAKYYKQEGKLETSLTSVAYCEGLLDALRLIGAVNFQWPSKQDQQ